MEHRHRRMGRGKHLHTKFPTTEYLPEISSPEGTSTFALAFRHCRAAESPLYLYPVLPAPAEVGIAEIRKPNRVLPRLRPMSSNNESATGEPLLVPKPYQWPPERVQKARASMCAR